jgi:hypothetical protein
VEVTEAMEEKIKGFFEGPGREAIEHLGSGGNILMTIAGSSYTVKITEEREVKVEKDGKEDSDIKISGEEKVMADLFSSASRDEYIKKMRSYIMEDKGPEVKILMPRTAENVRKFMSLYPQFLRRMFLLR